MRVMMVATGGVYLPLVGVSTGSRSHSSGLGQSSVCPWTQCRWLGRRSAHGRSVLRMISSLSGTTVVASVYGAVLGRCLSRSHPIP